MSNTVEVPSDMVMVRTIRAGKQYLLSNEVLDLVNEAAGIKYAAFVNHIFHLPNDGDSAKFKAAVESLKDSYIGKIEPYIVPIGPSDLRDQLLILRHTIKSFLLDGYPADDNTGCRAHILYVFLGILLGKSDTQTFLQLLKKY